MLEPQEQTEQDRRKAYMDGFKMSLETLYSMIAEGVQRGLAYRELLGFHDHDLFIWSDRDLKQPLPPPAVVVRR